MALAVPSFNNPLHTCCPPLTPLAKESLSVGRTGTAQVGDALVAPFD